VGVAEAIEGPGSGRRRSPGSAPLAIDDLTGSENLLLLGRLAGLGRRAARGAQYMDEAAEPTDSARRPDAERMLTRFLDVAVQAGADPAALTARVSAHPIAQASEPLPARRQPGGRARGGHGLPPG
jgi:hypothetical protein